MKGLHIVTWLLLVIGGLNWGLELFGVGVGRFVPEIVAQIIYALVAISAIVEIVNHKKRCADCNTGGSAPAAPAGNPGGGM